MKYVVATTGDDKGVRRQIADQVNQVACCGVVRHSEDDRASSVDAGMLEYVPLRGVTYVPFQTVPPCYLDVGGVEIDRHHLPLLGIHQAFSNSLSGRAKADD